MINLNNFIVIFVTTIALIILFHKKMRTSKRWLATVISLVSIIGSGFLVSAPLLLLTSGRWAVIVMAAIADTVGSGGLLSEATKKNLQREIVIF